MLEEELSKIWKSSPQQEQVKFDKSRLILDVQSNVDEFQKQMKNMYIREGLATLLVMPIFSYYAYLAPHVLTKTGFLLVALWAGYILFVLKKSKDKAPDQFSMNYLEYLQQTKVYLESSKKNRETVLVWYISPIVGAIWLAMLGVYLSNPDALSYMLITGSASLIAGVGIHFLNKRSAKNFVAPKLDKVNELIRSLQE